MAQASTAQRTIPTSPSGMAAITAANQAMFDALFSASSGTVAPASPVKGMSWLDTSASPNILNVYDGSQWLRVGAIDTTNHTFTPGGGGYREGAPTIYDTAGSYTWTKPANCIGVKVRVWGAGGGGGGAAGVNYSAAAGGGAGGYSTETILSGLGSTVAVTVGAAGARNTNTGGDGNSGGTSSFGSFLSATGGSGGGGDAGGSTFAIPAGGAGGSGVNGDANSDGTGGQFAVRAGSNSARSLAKGGQGVDGFGSGGAGAAGSSAASGNGVDGLPGRVVVTPLYL